MNQLEIDKYLTGENPEQEREKYRDVSQLIQNIVRDQHNLTDPLIILEM